MTRRTIGILGLLVLLAAACGSGDDVSSAESGDSGGSGDSSNADGDSSGDGDSGGDDDAGGSGGDGDGDADDVGDTGPDDDDAAAILGDPDLDLDALPDDVADALDDIDDVVSIGECRSELVGLAITAADDWMCRVLDQAVGGLDGFTMFTAGNDVNLTITTPSPLGAPCDLLAALCDSAAPIDLSDNFPDTQVVEIGGAIVIFGGYKDSDAELAISSNDALTDEEIELLSTVLDSAVPI